LNKHIRKFIKPRDIIIIHLIFHITDPNICISNKISSEKEYSFDEICKTSDNNSTNPLLESLRAQEINIETVVLIDILVNFLRTLKVKINDPLGINKDMINLLLKYKLIMLQGPLPRNKLKEKVLNTFTKC
jgi:hypothetical protein